eukprot:scaffold133848_cov44-Cyclotella_meneghiniana.AAC.1
MDTDPASSYLTVKFICLRKDPFLQALQSSHWKHTTCFPDASTTICLGISRQNTTNVVLILWSLTSRSFLTILGSSGHFSTPMPYQKWTF